MQQQQQGNGGGDQTSWHHDITPEQQKHLFQRVIQLFNTNPYFTENKLKQNQIEHFTKLYIMNYWQHSKSREEFLYNVGNIPEIVKHGLEKKKQDKLQQQGSSSSNIPSQQQQQQQNASPIGMVQQQHQQQMVMMQQHPIQQQPSSTATTGYYPPNNTTVNPMIPPHQQIHHLPQQQPPITTGYSTPTTSNGLVTPPHTTITPNLMTPSPGNNIAPSPSSTSTNLPPSQESSTTSSPIKEEEDIKQEEDQKEEEDNLVYTFWETWIKIKSLKDESSSIDYIANTYTALKASHEKMQKQLTHIKSTIKEDNNNQINRLISTIQKTNELISFLKQCFIDYNNHYHKAISELKLNKEDAFNHLVKNSKVEISKSSLDFLKSLYKKHLDEENKKKLEEEKRRKELEELEKKRLEEERIRLENEELTRKRLEEERKELEELRKEYKMCYDFITTQFLSLEEGMRIIKMKYPTKVFTEENINDLKQKIGKRESLLKRSFTEMSNYLINDLNSIDLFYNFDNSVNGVNNNICLEPLPKLKKEMVNYPVYVDENNGFLNLEHCLTCKQVIYNFLFDKQFSIYNQLNNYILNLKHLIDLKIKFYPMNATIDKDPFILITTPRNITTPRMFNSVTQTPMIQTTPLSVTNSTPMMTPMMPVTTTNISNSITTPMPLSTTTPVNVQYNNNENILVDGVNVVDTTAGIQQDNNNILNSYIIEIIIHLKKENINLLPPLKLFVNLMMEDGLTFIEPMYELEKFTKNYFYFNEDQYNYFSEKFNNSLTEEENNLQELNEYQKFYLFSEKYLKIILEMIS
ncbi:hypothetical protein ABK040_002370 [Willaertia magna]